MATSGGGPGRSVKDLMHPPFSVTPDSGMVAGPVFPLGGLAGSSIASPQGWNDHYPPPNLPNPLHLAHQPNPRAISNIPGRRTSTPPPEYIPRHNGVVSAVDKPSPAGNPCFNPHDQGPLTDMSNIMSFPDLSGVGFPLQPNVPYAGRTIKSDVCLMLFEKTQEEVKAKEDYLVNLILGCTTLTAAVLAVTPLLWQLRNTDDHCCQPLNQEEDLNCCFGIPQASRPRCCETTEDLVFNASSHCSVAQSAILVRRAGVSLFSALAFCVLMLTVVLSFTIPSVLVLRERARSLEFIFCPESQACKVRMLFWTLGMRRTEPQHRIALDSMRYVLMVLITSILCSLCVTMSQYFDRSQFCHISEDENLLLQDIVDEIWIVPIFFSISLIIVLVRLLWLHNEEDASYDFVFNYARRWKREREQEARIARGKQQGIPRQDAPGIRQRGAQGM